MHIYIYIIFILAINLIKKKSKNKIELLNNFYNFYSSENSNIIDLKENDYNNSYNKNEISNSKKLNEIIEENRKLDYLIKIIDDKLSTQIEKENGNENEYDKISLVKSDLIPLIPDINNYTNLMVINSESGIKVKDFLKKESKNEEQKKFELYMGELNKENIDLSSYSNKSYIISNNNSSLSIINVNLKKEDQEEKENPPTNNNKNENKLENDKINNFFNEERKDSIISCFSSFDNISNYSL